MADYTYDLQQKFDMVFEGGGAKGMVFVGAQKSFEKRGFVPARLIGTSAGATTATLLAAGYDAQMMEDALAETDANGDPVFAGFMDAPEEGGFSAEDISKSLTMDIFRAIKLPFPLSLMEGKIDGLIIKQCMKLKICRVLFSFIERGGLYAGDAFLTWFREKLEAAVPEAGTTTLEKFHETTGADLSVVASNTTAREMMVLNHRTAPKCPVAWAVRMSMSIPFAWPEVRWDARWGECLGDDIAGHTVVDGGALSNFPIDLLTSREAHVEKLMGADADADENPTVGLLIDESLPVPGAPPPPGDDGEEDGVIDNIKNTRTANRVKHLINTMTDAHDAMTMDAHANQICRLPAQTYGTMDFDMSDARRKALVDAGEKAMDGYLSGLIDAARSSSEAAGESTAASGTSGF